MSEYQTVERRIANNEALIQKLEETAQAIYHHTFVEGIDEENLPDCPNMETLRLLLCGNYLRNIQIDPLTAMVYLTAPNLRAYGAVQSFIVCPHCGRRTSVVEGAARQCEHCGMGI